MLLHYAVTVHNKGAYFNPNHDLFSIPNQEFCLLNRITNFSQSLPRVNTLMWCSTKYTSNWNTSLKVVLSVRKKKRKICVMDTNQHIKFWDHFPNCRKMSDRHDPQKMNHNDAKQWFFTKPNQVVLFFKHVGLLQFVSFQFRTLTLCLKLWP